MSQAVIEQYIVDRLDVGAFVLNANMEVELWNQFMQTHSGLMQAEVMGKSIFTLFPELPERWFKRKVDSVFILKNRAFTSWEQRPYIFKFSHNRPVTGGLEYMYQNCVFMPIKGDSGDVESVCITVYDATDEAMGQQLLQQANQRLEYISQVDALTQLYNRGYWESALKTEFTRFQRYEQSNCLLLFDLDHFKKVNDTYGHTAGDDVLRAVSSELKSSIRETDVAGRYGGEEFAVVLVATDAVGAMTMAERIRGNIEALDIQSGDLTLKVTASLGVVEFDQSYANHEKLISAADQALYQSKEQGRNCCSLFQAVS